MQELKQYAAQIAAEEYGVHPSWLKKKTREGDIVKARQLACYLMNHIAGFSTIETAKYLNIDHASVIHSRKKVMTEYDLQTQKGNYANEQFRKLVDRCTAKMPEKDNNAIVIVLKQGVEITQGRLTEIIEAINQIVTEPHYIKATCRNI